VSKQAIQTWNYCSTGLQSSPRSEQRGEKAVRTERVVARHMTLFTELSKELVEAANSLNLTARFAVTLKVPISTL
jgi:hypothetical protein